MRVGTVTAAFKTLLLTDSHGGEAAKAAAPLIAGGDAKLLGAIALLE
jgi:hypothetical protein